MSVQERPDRDIDDPLAEQPHGSHFHQVMFNDSDEGNMIMKITTPNGVLEGESIEAIIAKNGKDCLWGADLSGADLCGANLSGADLWGADLRGANLRGADLCGAYLCGAYLSDANLRGADLWGADLSGADLSDAYLSGAYLSDANLRGADLSDAYLSGADLSDAYLSGANLSDANLRGANLRGADLSGAKNIPALTIAKTSIIPDEGDVIGWKKALAEDGTQIIVKLLIPTDAQRSNSTGRKCRASKARVLDIQDMNGNSLNDTIAHSSHDEGFTYKVGETVQVDDFDTNRWNECAPGIHFFITRIEAVTY